MSLSPGARRWRGCEKSWTGLQRSEQVQVVDDVVLRGGRRGEQACLAFAVEQVDGRAVADLIAAVAAIGFACEGRTITLGKRFDVRVRANQPDRALVEGVDVVMHD